MKPLLIKAALGHFKKHPFQAGLAVIGVALGVAVFVGIEGANGSALRAFELSTVAITGRTTHQIIGESAGVPESFYRKLRLDLGVRWSAPVIEGFVSLVADDDSRPRFRLLGVDSFAEAAFRGQLEARPGTVVDLAAFMTRPGVVLSAPVASVRSIGIGDELGLLIAGRLERVEVVGLFEPASDFDRQAAADLLICDISTAQTLLRLGDRLSRIDLIAPRTRDGASATDPLAPIRAALPAGTKIVRPEQRSAAAEQMTRAFRLNLRALSLLALLCGAFLIYNTMTFAVVQRRPALGTLRALGATSRELFAIVLSEAAVVGGIGALLGCAVGSALARLLVARVTQTVNDLYFAVNVREVAVPSGVLVAGSVLGIGAALVAAMGPAAEALRTVPRSALARAELEGRTRRAIPAVTVLGALVVIAGATCLSLPLTGLISSFAGLFMVLVGMACLTPATTLVLMRLLTPGAGRVFGNLGRLSARGVVATLSRTGVAIAALMMTVAVTVGVDVMIRSFRGTVDRWLAYSLPADLYLTSQGALTDRYTASPAALSAADITKLRALEGVARVTTVRTARVGSSVGPVRLLAHDLGRFGQSAFRLKAGDDGEAWDAYYRGDAVLISEPFWFRHGLELGATLSLETPAGRRGFPVAGIFYDYATEEGSVLLAQPSYRELWGDFGITAAALYLGTADLASVETAALRTLGEDRELVIRSNRLLRDESLRVFDRTFVVTGVLRLLAVLVAFVGVLAALTALQLERGRELGVLRALGLTPREVWTLVTTQTAMIGAVAGVLAIPVGLTMAAIMIHVINRRSFGWSLEMTVSPEPLLAAVVLSVGAALLAGLYPAYRMSRTSPAEALRGE
ncbi:MAG: ABC transporter permease [bacterium]|nr:ABC transporter permease [bacterium]